MTEQLARKVEAEGEATSLVALISSGDVDGALALNGRVAATMPHLRPVEGWFVRRITDRCGKPSGSLASGAWEAARANADPALEAVAKATWFETWQWWQGEKAAADKRPEWAKVDWDEPEPTAKVEAKAEPAAKPKAKVEPKPSGLRQRLWSEVVIPPGTSELEALTYVPGVIGDIVEWILKCAPRPNRMMALGVALVVVGTLIGRRVVGPTGSATHLYIIILGPSGFGKGKPMACGKILIEGVGVIELIGPDEFASSVGFWKRLKRSPLLICFIDELGDELAKINGQSGNDYVTAIVGTLKKCYNAFEDQRTAEKAAEGQESELIRWPAVSVVGAATPEAFFSGLRQRDLASGFANRMLVLPFEGSRRPPEQAVSADALTPPKGIIDALKRLPRQRALDVLNTKPNEIGKPKLDPPMPWGPEADEAYFAFSRRFDDLAEIDTERFELSMRSCENAVRMATNLATSCGSPSVDVEDIKWAIALAERSLDAMVGGVERYMERYYAFPKFCAKVLDRLRQEKDGFLPEYELKRTFQNNMKQGFEIGNVIKHLIDTLQIHRTKKRLGARGSETVIVALGPE